MTESTRITEVAAAGDPDRKARGSAPPRPPTKAKRTLTRDNFFRTIGNCIASSPVLIRSFVRPRIPLVLREKLYLAVTSINECRFCQWGHTHWALAHGLSLEEVNQMLGTEAIALEAMNQAEAVAVLFARHYAEQLDRFDPASVENLRGYYSDPQVKEILAHVRFITLTNLSGNTVDAFLGRFHNPAQPVGAFQFVIGAVLAPILLVIVSLVKIERALAAATGRPRVYEARHGPGAEAGRSREREVDATTDST
jgi:AhpD family alkylhydroperoxidase